METIFISGHRNLTETEFNEIYVPAIKREISKESESGIMWVLADYPGADSFAQKWLSENLEDPSRVTVYHMGPKPMFLANTRFSTSSGWETDIERDSRMTKVSDLDIAFVRDTSCWNSGTAQNILRRKTWQNSPKNPPDILINGKPMG